MQQSATLSPQVTAAEPVRSPLPAVFQAADLGGRRVLVVDSAREALPQPGLVLLRQNGIAVDAVATPAEARARAASGSCDVVLMDICDPGFDAVSFCLELSASGLAAVVVWSGDASVVDQVTAFEAGAEDFVSRTAHPLELLARVRAALRRRALHPRPAEPAAAPIVVRSGAVSWRFDRVSYEFEGVEGRRVVLTGSEVELLMEFARRPRDMVLRSEFASLLARGEPMTPRALDTRVARLRRTLEKVGGGELIRTRRHRGYFLHADVEIGDRYLTLWPPAQVMAWERN